ncbi:MAG TPA: hypothetical protein VFW94_24255 [Candidatus Acidoferrales bacterium]|nr:hypothetical protein [Candidatus Acidoferrales bacterium]
MTRTYSDAFGMQSEAIEEKIAPGEAVYAPRRTGKTTALMNVVYKKHNGEAIVMCHSSEEANRFRDAYQRRFPTRRVPVVLSPSLIKLLEAHRFPLYVDEWWMLSLKVRRVLLAYGVAGAVGTVPELSSLAL